MVDLWVSLLHLCIIHDSMKKFAKIFVSASIVLVLCIIASAFYYFSQVYFGTNLNVVLPADKTSDIKAVSPTRGIIMLQYDKINSSYHDSGRFFKDLIFEGDTSQLKITIKINDVEISVGSKDLEKRADGKLYLRRTLYPAYSLKEKLADINKLNLKNLVFSRASQTILKFMKYALPIALLGLLIWLVFLQTKKKSINKEKLKSLLTSVFIFIKRTNIKLLIPAAVGVIPAWIYLIFDENVLKFLDISYVEFLCFYGILMFPFFFSIVFADTLKLNRLFWTAFLLIFVVNYFFIYPDVYIYGDNFRDDLSKFFVKAHQENFLECLFTPNSGYLNVIQSLICFILLKVLGIKQYFPEILQITTLLVFSLLIASFNLKIFRHILPNKWIWFILSLLIGLTNLLIPKMLWLFDLAFLATMLFWLLLFSINKLTRSGFVLFLIIFVIFILSKPVYVVFSPLLLFIFLEGVIKKNQRYIICSILFMLAILSQVVVQIANPISQIAVNPGNGLGTEYFSSFRQDEMSLLTSAVLGIFVYLRLFYTLWIPYLPAGWPQIVANLLLGGFILFLNISFIVRYLRKKRMLDFFILCGNLLALFSSALFIKTAPIKFITHGNELLTEMSFSDLIQSAYVVPEHRYLILAFLPVILSLIYFLIMLQKKYFSRYHFVVMTGLIILLVINRLVVVNNISGINQMVKIKPHYKSMARPTVSLWRQQSSLIFDYREGYYIPYYGYPTQSECIKYGIDRITDVSVPAHGTVYLDSLPYDTRQWKIIQIITESDAAFASKISLVKGKTVYNETVSACPFYAVDSMHRFIIFRFNNFHNLKEINFADTNNNIIIPANMVRLIGTYE